MCILLSRSSVFKSNNPLYPCMKCGMKMNLHDEGESLDKKNTANYQLPTDLIRRRELNRKTQKIYIFMKKQTIDIERVHSHF